MKKPLPIIFILLCPLLALAGGFTLKGNIGGLQTGIISLAYHNEAGDDTTLTTHIAGGAFTFAGRVPEPELVTLTVTEGWPYNVSFFLENSVITMSLVKDVPEKTIITGSFSHTIYEKLKPGQFDFFAHARENAAAHQAHGRHEAAGADSLWAMQQHQWMQTIRTTITPHPDNYAALYFIQWLLFRPDHLDSIWSVFMQLSPAVRQGMAGRKFQADFEHLHRTAAGQSAPDISGRDTAGQPLTLASYRGRVVLLDFWASYCAPCRQENRRMLSVYQKYHASGFEMVSFSLDNERSLWLTAMRSDGLTWPQASDLRGGAGATAGIYDITDLPRNVLIDRTGKIYARDLHGDDLIEVVESLLKKRE